MNLFAIVVSDRPLEGGAPMRGWHVATARIPHDDADLDAIGRAARLRAAAHDLRRRALIARDGSGAVVPEAFRTPTPAGTFVSLSHTRGAIATALASSPVGIDVERLDRSADAPRLAARYFAADERDGFVWRWTAKEALMKATGMTLRAALKTSMGPPSYPPLTTSALGIEIATFTIEFIAVSAARTPI